MIASAPAPTGPQERQTTRFRGVGYDAKTGAWRARIFVDGRQLHVGRYDSEEVAAEAFDAVAAVLRGRAANLGDARAAERLPAFLPTFSPGLRAILVSRGVDVESVCAAASSCGGPVRRRRSRAASQEPYSAASGSAAAAASVAATASAPPSCWQGAPRAYASCPAPLPQQPRCSGGSPRWAQAAGDPSQCALQQQLAMLAALHQQKPAPARAAPPPPPLTPFALSIGDDESSNNTHWHAPSGGVSSSARVTALPAPLMFTAGAVDRAARNQSPFQFCAPSYLAPAAGGPAPLPPAPLTAMDVGGAAAPAQLGVLTDDEFDMLLHALSSGAHDLPLELL